MMVYAHRVSIEKEAVVVVFLTFFLLKLMVCGCFANVSWMKCKMCGGGEWGGGGRGGTAGGFTSCIADVVV